MQIPASSTSSSLMVFARRNRACDDNDWPLTDKTVATTEFHTENALMQLPKARPRGTHTKACERRKILSRVLGVVQVVASATWSS